MPWRRNNGLGHRGGRHGDGRLPVWPVALGATVVAALLGGRVRSEATDEPVSEAPASITASTWAAAEALWHEIDPDAAPIEDLLLPLEHHADGTVKTLLRAESATMPPRGLIRAENFVVENYNEQKRLVAVLSAERCIYDQRLQRALCLGKVRFQHQDISVRGSNVLWISGEELIKVYTSAEVRFPRRLIDLRVKETP